MFKGSLAVVGVLLLLAGCSVSESPTEYTGGSSDLPNTIAGTIHNSEGKPAVRAKVMVLAKKSWWTAVENGQTIPVDSGYTDSSGAFTIQTQALDSFSMQIEYGAEGAYISDAQNSTAANGQVSIDQPIITVVGYEYRGTLLVNEVMPTKVLVAGSLYEAPVDSTGVFRFINLPEGLYPLVSVYQSGSGVPNDRLDESHYTIERAYADTLMSSSQSMLSSSEEYSSEETDSIRIADFEDDTWCTLSPSKGECDQLFWKVLVNTVNWISPLANGEDGLTSHEYQLINENGYEGSSLHMILGGERRYSGLALTTQSGSIHMSGLDSLSFFVRSGQESMDSIDVIFYSNSVDEKSAAAGTFLYTRIGGVGVEWNRFVVPIPMLRVGVLIDYTLTSHEVSTEAIRSHLASIDNIQFQCNGDDVSIDNIDLFGTEPFFEVLAQ